MKEKKIAVVMGGPSREREVSLRTGNAILKALQGRGYQAVGIDFDPRRFAEQLRESDVEVVFNAIHGLYGEDGRIQGMLDILGLPYTGSGVTTNAVAMDKWISKCVFLQAGIPTPKSRLLSAAVAQDPQCLNSLQKEFAFPLVVKAVDQGSSIGVEIVRQEADLAAALQRVGGISERLLVEEFIAGREFTVAVWGDDAPDALPIIEIVPKAGWYNYDTKYTKGATDYLVPADLPAAVAAGIQEVAVAAYVILGCRGIARVDLLLDERQYPFVLEVNTVPGMTETSLVPKAAAAAGIPFDILCERLLAGAASGMKEDRG